jgi:hypothetical protein
VHCQAGNEEWSDDDHRHIHLGVCISILPQEQGNYGFNATGVQESFQGRHNIEAYIDEFKDMSV